MITSWKYNRDWNSPFGILIGRAIGTRLSRYASHRRVAESFKQSRILVVFILNVLNHVYTIEISTDIEMPTLREALSSPTLNPCFTLMIFSFMVSFTLSILDLALQIAVLHLPVLIMWLITISSVLLTVAFWYCQRSNSPALKRLRDGTSKRFGRDRNLERSFLSQVKEEGSQRETVNYGLESKTESSSLANEWTELFPLLGLHKDV